MYANTHVEQAAAGMWSGSVIRSRWVNLGANTEVWVRSQTKLHIYHVSKLCKSFSPPISAARNNYKHIHTVFKHCFRKSRNIFWLHKKTSFDYTKPILQHITFHTPLSAFPALSHLRRPKQLRGLAAQWAHVRRFQRENRRTEQREGKRSHENLPLRMPVSAATPGSCWEFFISPCDYRLKAAESKHNVIDNWSAWKMSGTPAQLEKWHTWKESATAGDGFWH